MPNIDTLKADLIDKLWLPKVKEAKTLIYPKRRKNARMSLLTLTDGLNLREISKFEEENLIQREDSVAWVKNMLKRTRVESESVGYVFDGHVYAETFLGPSCLLNRRFPFEIINLDFESQEPPLEQGRIEKEIEKIERVIRLQDQRGCNKFVLIYTTLIDAHDIDANGVVLTSNAANMGSGNIIELSDFTSPITDSNRKQDFLCSLFKKLMQKYTYECIPGVTCLSYEIPGRDERLFSVVGIFTR